MPTSPEQGNPQLDASWVWMLVRFGIYMAVCGALAAAFLNAVDYLLESGQFRERGLVETAQLAMTLVAMGVLLLGAWWVRSLRAIFLFNALLAGIAAVREMDSQLDDTLPLGWKLPAGALLAAALVVVWLARHSFAWQTQRWVLAMPFGILWAGFVTVTIFAQTLGQADVWKLVLGEGYTRPLKQFVEESAETIGYVLILIGAIEAIFFHRGVEAAALPGAAAGERKD